MHIITKFFFQRRSTSRKNSYRYRSNFVLFETEKLTDCLMAQTLSSIEAHRYLYLLMFFKDASYFLGTSLEPFRYFSVYLNFEE